MLTSLPNLLTLSRIAVIPVVVALLLLDGPATRWAACALFAAACVTDWLDGYLARRMNDVSSFGRILDPIADKLLVAAVLLLLVADRRIPGLAVLPAMVILMRELLVSGLREFLAGLDVSVPVSRLAKWKTVLQMVALGLLIVGDAAAPADRVGLFGLWLAAGLTVVTGYDYLRHGVKHMLGGTSSPGPADG
jgi:cardiolipin synthase